MAAIGEIGLDFHYDHSPREKQLEVLDWMLAPLAVIWPVSLAVTYAIGMSIADAPFDRELRERVLSVVDDVTRPGIRVPGSSGPFSGMITFRAAENIR